MDEIRAELPQMIMWLRAWGQTDLDVMFGVGYRDHDKAWASSFLRLDELDEFPRRNEVEHLFGYGDTDLFISFGPEKKNYFLLCHESDIHFRSEQADLLRIVKHHWIGKGWRGAERSGDQGSEWIKFA